MYPDVGLISLRFGRLRGAIPPLGPLCLKASLEAAGISCRITDVQFDPAINPFAVEAVADGIRKSRSSVIAFSVFNDAVPLVIAALNSLHGIRDLPRMVIGGPGVVGIAARLLETAPLIDMVVVGEGESVLPVAIRDRERAATFPGVFSRGRDGGAIGAGRTARERLNRLPPVDWHSLPDHRYTIVPWSTMRGCPFSCEFCEIIAFMGRRVVARDIIAHCGNQETPPRRRQQIGDRPPPADRPHFGTPHFKIEGSVNMPTNAIDKTQEIYQIKVTLLGTDPPIWRRVLVPSDLTLEQLHDVVQLAMGWEDCHMHDFRIGQQRFGQSDPMEQAFGGSRTASERTARLSHVLGRAGAKAVYTYDFGDGWQHQLAVEKRLPPEPGRAYPAWSAGERHGPPEDCGGIPGFYNLLEAISNPEHEEHDELLEWLGDNFDPEAFSVDEV